MPKRGRPVKAGTVLAKVRRQSGKSATPAVIDVSPLDDDPALFRLKIRIIELKRQANRDGVEAIVELGELLQEGRPRAKRNFGRWVDDMGIGRTTAHRYMGMAAMAAAEPEILQKYKELGPTKLYLLLRLPKKKRLGILGRHADETLFRMTDAEYVETIIAPHAIAIERHVTPAMKAHGFTMKINAWYRDVREFRAYKKKNKEAVLSDQARGRLLELRKMIDELV